MPYEFRALFTPVRVGSVTLKNRIYSSGHAEAMAEGGRPTSRLARYHEAKAQGGCALTIFGGSSSVHPSSPAAAWKQIANHDDSVIPGYRAIADAVHRHDCLLFTQLTHLGRRAQSDPEVSPVLLAPSQIPERVHREVPHELEPEQIATLVRAFGEAARRCRAGHLDGIELSMAHNHLIDQFWCPLFNRRTDEYGGSLENRMRFAFDVLAEIRRQVGRDFVVGARISGDEFTAGGLSAGDMAEIARRLAASKLVDFLSIIGGGAHTYALQAAAVPNMSFPTAVYVPLAEAIKRAAPALPILHASRIVDPIQADELAAAGQVDVVGMTRALIADPDLPRKAREGRFDDIRTCVGANEGCIDRIYLGKAVTCVQNPATGREGELGDIRKASVAKKVVVVGGGVAGLEAARVTALRGHRVVLFEKDAQLGGQVLLAARAPARAEYAGIVRFLAGQVKKLGVEIRLGAEAGAATVLAERPDAVVIATGSHPYVPPLPGADGKHVVTDRDVLADSARVGANVVVVDDVHTQQALSTAEHLLDQGKRVEVVSPLFYVGQDVGITSIAPLYARLFAKGAVLTPHTELRAIEGSAVIVANVHAGAERRIESVDTVVLAMGSRSTDTLYRALKGRVPELHAVGDCVAPRGVHQAILDGSQAGRAI
jgi:mycofactocin system FadH/OYE family oxidoreductase 2